MEYQPVSENLDNLSHVADLYEGFPEPPDVPDSYPGVRKMDILDYGDEGFLLEGLMSEEECYHYINSGEGVNFKEIKEASKSYRNSQRISFKCDKLASRLFERIQPFLNDIVIEGDPHRKHIHGIKSLLQGSWKPSKLNPLFRLCRYNSGGHFAPHFDGFFSVSTKERSLQTLMIYLNCPPQFTGGATNFVDEEQTLYMDEEGRYCAEEKNVQFSVLPEAGLGIIFNHHRLHEGQALKEGVKYILRTDILFEKVSDELIDPNEEKALTLVQQAERLEALGDNMAAMELYRKAFKLSPELELSY